MKRRDFLKQTAIAASASLLLESVRTDGYRLVGAAFAGSNGDDQKATLEQKFAEFAISIRYEALPADVVASAKRVLLDTLGCAFGSVGSEPANIAETTIRKTFGDGNTATVIGYPRPATVEGALFVNGVLVRSLDLNDTYIGTEPLHPSEVLPTAIALREENGRSGRDLIEAMVAGYEASMRVNDAISFIERGFHPLCAASYGIPLIAGKIWGLPKEAIANAVGIPGARGFTSFVVNSGAISMMKAMGLAATAADGVFATRLAAQGFTGPSGTLDWLASKMKPTKEGFAVDLELARYRLPRVAFKRFPVQIELQAVAEAGASLSAKIKGRAQDIRAMTVETYPGISGSCEISAADKGYRRSQSSRLPRHGSSRRRCDGSAIRERPLASPGRVGVGGEDFCEARRVTHRQAPQGARRKHRDCIHGRSDFARNRGSSRRRRRTTALATVPRTQVHELRGSCN